MFRLESERARAGIRICREIVVAMRRIPANLIRDPAVANGYGRGDMRPKERRDNGQTDFLR